ncbi:MAG TPA: NAD(P)-dependent oxidoreductase [Ktedonobacteraceae bacterium]|nr:NAD(P)-dependent oxidoreductase [Ktedonobacteraceae bacterium]
MNIFLTGATGVLGKATLPLLLAAGHKVYALSRSESNATIIRQMGAEPITVDLFDSQALAKVLKETKAEAVIHLATKIPPTTRAGKLASWQENDHIRRDGTRALVDAALTTGVQTLIYPSYYFVYPDSGDRWIDAESTPPQPHPIVQSTLDAEAEVARFTKAQRRGIVLRMGSFYGPQVPSAMEQYRMAQKGFAMMPGRGEAYLCSIWIEDAARAIVIALVEAPAGIYDIVDDEPLTRDAFATTLAQSVGKRRLFRIPNGILMLLVGALRGVATRSQRVSNRRFKELTSWRPTVPNMQKGWSMIK